ncbi:hypothetical protein DPMN_097412 [Dreissena polymorpha]|uniref:Uncharacterized protein n=1 Tax=Dreissena polymorpha TaxID=45954 RepID=A0A9D4LBQ6_DREPO|nr:hypothetical protein DPMN_097412 [Dreissena polymorpha]
MEALRPKTTVVIRISLSLKYNIDIEPHFRLFDVQNIIGTNLLTKKNAPPPGSHVFQPTGIIFEHFQDIIGMNLLTKFHEDRTVNVASRVLTRFYYSRIRKNAPPLGSHVFQANIIIFELIQDIIETNLMTKFHEDWTINVASRVLTSAHAQKIPNANNNIQLVYKEKCPAPAGHTNFHDDRKINVTSRVLTSGHAFLPIRTIFGLNRHIQQTHVLTKFHEHWTKNVTSRLENSPAPLTAMVFSPIWTIFELVRDINETNVLTKFHGDWAKIVTFRVFTRNTAPPPGGHVFQRTGTIFELNQHIIETNILIKLQENWASNVTSTVFTSFELSRGINETNVLTKFHEDRTINVASSVHKANVDGARRTKGDHKSSQ